MKTEEAIVNGKKVNIVVKLDDDYKDDRFLLEDEDLEDLENGESYDE